MVGDGGGIWVDNFELLENKFKIVKFFKRLVYLADYLIIQYLLGTKLKYCKLIVKKVYDVKMCNFYSYTVTLERWKRQTKYFRPKIFCSGWLQNNHWRSLVFLKFRHIVFLIIIFISVLHVMKTRNTGEEHRQNSAVVEHYEHLTV